MSTIRTRILLSLAGVALLLVGIAGGMLLGGRFNAQAAPQQHGTVRAGSGNTAHYCQIYEQTVADELHVDPAALEKANIDGLTKALDQMVADGQLTKTERDQLVPLLQQMGNQPCTHLDGKAITSYLQSNPLIGQQFLAAHAALNSAVAGALHMTPDALATAVGKGQTIAQLAAQQHVALKTVNDAYLAAAKSYLAQAVSSGLITQDQSGYVSQALAKAVAQGHYPLVDSMPGMGAGA
jgi:hypothetical protein